MKSFDLGACRHVDPAVFDPAPGDEITEARAKRYCHTCPVRLDCLALALRVPNMPGIWGGLTAIERARHARSSTIRSTRQRHDEARSTARAALTQQLPPNAGQSSPSISTSPSK